LPDVPTMKEAGLGDFEFVIWHGLYAPKGTPKDVVAALNKALQVALADQTVKSRFADVGTQTFPAAELAPPAHRARLEKEVAKWREVVAKAGISPAN
jgi:tripartite-type tricarboxylate transporter receptor subunit TctC